MRTTSDPPHPGAADHSAPIPSMNAGTSAANQSDAQSQHSKHAVELASTTDGLPVSPSLSPALDASDVPSQPSLVDARVVLICGICVVLAIAAACIAQILM